MAPGGVVQPAPGARYGLAILFAVALFNYIDRSIVAILQEPIKRDLGLSDTQLGLLTGLSFALVYATMALPIARIADRVNRKKLIAIALAIWSGATALSGLARNFPTLVALRMGVAFGEAGSVPASHSMISDYFPLGRRGTALALWGLSNPLGTMLGFAFGGMLADALSWREAFLIFGVAGLAFAPIVLTAREPVRGTFDHGASTDRMAFRDTVAFLWRTKAFRYLLVGGVAHAFIIHLLHSWNAPFYVRVFDLPIREVALFLALSTGLAGGMGQFLGGWLGDRLAGDTTAWYMRLPAIASALLLPVTLVQYLAPGRTLSMVMGASSLFLIAIFYAPVVAAAQTVVPPRMRAFTSAVLVLCTNLLGLSLAPVLAGAISDYLDPIYGDQSLRYALAILMPMSALAVFGFVKAAQHMRAMERA